MKVKEKAAIDSLKLCQALMLFNPTSGEDISYEELNRENKDLYDACGIAINALENQLGYCNLCDDHRGCDNCYYGQVESIGYNCDCDSTLSGWEPLGDTFCRNCGRKLS